MAISSDDIKLLRSAVMADVPEGGGAMTGVQIVDGLDNNIFPDVSSDDRAAGRTNFRKVFGVAHTNNTDLLLGASFAIMEAPEDPLVHVSLFETDGWADERTAAQEAVERYLVKGPKLLSRIQDVHYQGALLLQLYAISPGSGFPAPGDSVVLRNPSGAEQYVRIYSTTESTQTVIIEGQARAVNLCSCELSAELEFDVQGKPIQLAEPSSANTAVVYSTTPAIGARFYGFKELGVNAAIGDRSITVADGIFTPIVPAATVEEPVIDVFPLVARPTISRTAFGTITLASVASFALTAGAVIRFPTAIEPGSVSFTHGATTFTSNGTGELLQGTTVVGSVDHTGKTVTMLGSSPNYGTNSLSVTYKPATVTGATAYSASTEVTTANQGLSFVFAFEPPPAPGTLSVSYMAQGRWYELTENGTGRLAGSDTAYGTGTLSFTTGSLALTFGAIPDVGSDIIFLWGSDSSAKQALGTLPTKARMRVVFTDAPQPGTLSFAWSNGATNYTASVAADGTVTGPATVGLIERSVGGVYSTWFSPNVLPTGAVTVTYTKHTEAGSFTDNGGGSFTVAPHKPGSLKFDAIATSSGEPNRVVTISSKSNGILYAEGQPVGTVNATTGAVSLSTPTFEVQRWKTVKRIAGS